MLSINRITLVKERDKSRELIGMEGDFLSPGNGGSHPSIQPKKRRLLLLFVKVAKHHHPPAPTLSSFYSLYGLGVI